ncbi:glycosyltransferase family 4 protein [Candidatus Roizmanbacteria bacterium]|nr:glycosyltransferase family 4 protein [Candidatus Roizmanbacteria bacterium]
MRILMLTPYVPYPPSSGGQVRTYNLLKHLSKTNKITLICLYKNPEEKKYLNKLKPYCQSVYFCQRSPHPWTIRNIFKSVFSLKPFLIVRNYSLEAENILKEILEKQQFDIIHAETFYIMPHLPKTRIPIFLLEQTIEYQVYQHFVNSLPFFVKPAFSLDILKLKIWEKNYWKKAYMVGAVSDTDKQIITRLEENIKPVIIPNGAGEDMITEKLGPKNLKKPVVLFQGNFFWLQNTEAANYLINKIMPIAKKRLPNLKFVIAGQNAANKIGQAKSSNLEIIDIGPKQNEEVRKIYQKATIFIAPIFGPGGTRLKILAAMASGIPVISTKTGVTGLTVKNNSEVLIANSPDEFIKSIEKIIRDENLYQKIRTNAYSLIKKKYNWEKIALKLESVYKTLVPPAVL